MTPETRIPFVPGRTARWFIGIEAGDSLPAIAAAGQDAIERVYDAADGLIDFREVELKTYRVSDYEWFINQRNQWRDGELSQFTETLHGDTANSPKDAIDKITETDSSERTLLSRWQTTEAATQLRIGDDERMVSKESTEFRFWKAGRWDETPVTEDPLTVLIRFSIDNDCAHSENSYEIVVSSNTDLWFRPEYDDVNYERIRQFLQTLASGEDVRSVRAASDYYREDWLLSVI